LERGGVEVSDGVGGYVRGKMGRALKPKRKGFRNGRVVDLSKRKKVVNCVVKGMNVMEASKVTGVSYSACRKILMEDMPREELDWYRAHMGDVLTVAAMKGQVGLNEVLESPELRQEMFLKHGPAAQAQLINMVRVEKGQPTEIRSVVDMRLDMNRLLEGLLRRFGAANFEEVARLVEGEVVGEGE
jgi:hypothetical protein